MTASPAGGPAGPAYSSPGQPALTTVPGSDAAFPLGTTPSTSHWHRLHPLSPLLRGGQVVLVVVGLLTRQVVEGIGPRAALIVLGVTLPAAAVYGALAWRFTRYRLVGATLRLETGVLVRRSRQVPLERLQAVDVVRGLAARVFGLAELRLEVAGHGKSEAPLRYLSDDAARALRARLLAVAAGAAQDTPPPPEQQLVAVPAGALIGSVLLGAPAVVGLLLVIAAGVVAAVAPRALPGLAASLLPALLGTGGVAIRRVNAEFGFTVADAPDGLRLRHGLLETRSQTIPADRVQAVRVEEPLLWRWRGWVRVEVDVAGYGGGREERSATSALLPVAPRALADALVARVLPGVDLRVPLTRPPRRARLRAPLLMRYLGVGWTEQYAVTAYGRLRRVVEVTPHVKVQSLRLVQGPVQRRLRLATLHLDTAGRVVTASARHRDEDEARQLLTSGADLARAARSTDLTTSGPP